MWLQTTITAGYLQAKTLYISTSLVARLIIIIIIITATTTITTIIIIGAQSEIVLIFQFYIFL